MRRGDEYGNSTLRGSGIEEVQNGLLDLPATLGIGDEVNLLGAVPEDAALNDAGREIIRPHTSFQSEIRLKNVRTP